MLMAICAVVSRCWRETDGDWSFEGGQEGVCVVWRGQGQVKGAYRLACARGTHLAELCVEGGPACQPSVSTRECMVAYKYIIFSAQVYMSQFREPKHKTVHDREFSLNICMYNYVFRAGTSHGEVSFHVVGGLIEVTHSRDVHLPILHNDVARAVTRASCPSTFLVRNIATCAIHEGWTELACLPSRNGRAVEIGVINSSAASV